MPERPYIYYDFTLSLCPECLKRVDAKIVFEDSKVFMLKNCSEHGFKKVLIATDVEYYKHTRNYNKVSEMPLKFNTSSHYGCPYDCGLCQDHEQHSCLTVVEITDRCNLSCPKDGSNKYPYSITFLNNITMLFFKKKEIPEANKKSNWLDERM